MREARNDISSFKKLSPPAQNLADIMLHYAACGIGYTNNYGDISMPFYNSIAGMFHDGCKLINENGLQDFFKDRCWKMVCDTSGIGWGFHDDLSEYYSRYIAV